MKTKQATIHKTVTRFCLSLAVLALPACGGGGTSISVTATDFKFEPTSVSLPAGQEIAITLVNQGTQKHEWVLFKLGESASAPFDADDEPKIHWEIEAEPGQTATGTFTAPSEPGTYQIVCGIDGHLEQGMVAQATVN